MTASTDRDVEEELRVLVVDLIRDGKWHCLKLARKVEMPTGHFNEMLKGKRKMSVARARILLDVMGFELRFRFDSMTPPDEEIVRTKSQ